MSRPITVGAVREDGYIFSKYHTNGKESWLSPSSYHRSRVNSALYNAKRRATKMGLPFDISIDTLLAIFPDDAKCPALGIKMVWGGDRLSSPSLDRRVPALGYVVGNVQWISGLANMIKSCATSEQVRSVADFLETQDNEHAKQTRN